MAKACLHAFKEKDTRLVADWLKSKGLHNNNNNNILTTTLTLFLQFLKGLCSPQLAQLFWAGYLN